MPELLQERWNPADLADLASELMATGGGGQPADLALVRERLGDPGASMQAAEAVLSHLP